MLGLWRRRRFKRTHVAVAIGAAALATGASIYAANQGSSSSTQGPKAHNFEVDHLISLELGGSNSIKNLWPEPGFPNPKDKLENRLHAMVCDGQISLAQAQHDIATNWVQSYRSVIGSAPHSPAHYDPHNLWSLPNHSLTPGALDPTANKTVVCTQSTKTRRNVPQSEKNQVYQEYGVTH